MLLLLEFYVLEMFSWADPVIESHLIADKRETYLFILPVLMDFDTPHMISLWHTQPSMPTHCVVQRWPPSCLNDSTSHQHYSVTHRSSLHDGLHNGLWWIMRLTFTQKQQKLFCPAGWRHTSLVLWVVSPSRGSVILFYLFDTGVLMKTASSWKCHFFAFCKGCSPRVAMATLYSPPAFFPCGKSSSLLFVSGFWAESLLLNNPVGLERISKTSLVCCGGCF